MPHLDHDVYNSYDVILMWIHVQLHKYKTIAK